MTSPYGVFPSGPFDPRYGQYRNEGGVFYPPVPTRVESAEEVRDIIGAALRAGTNVSIVVDDSGDTITISATGGGSSYTDEQVRDVVAAALRAGTGVTITPDDAGDTITIAATGLQVNTTGAAVGTLSALRRDTGGAFVLEQALGGKAQTVGKEFRLVLAGDQSGGIGGNGTVNGDSDSTPKLTIQSWQSPHGPNVGGFGQGIRLDVMHPLAKNLLVWRMPKDPTTAWSESNYLQDVLWMGAHYRHTNPDNTPGDVGAHFHWSIEVPDAAGALQTRFQVKIGNPSTGAIGLNKTNIVTSNADFTVATENGAMRLAGDASVKTLEYTQNQDGTGKFWQIKADGTASNDLILTAFISDSNSLPVLRAQRATGRITIGQTAIEAGTALALAWSSATDRGFVAKPAASIGTNAAYTALLQATTDRAIDIRDAAGTTPRWEVDGTGAQKWGPGSAARDTTLYRAGVGILKTDTAMHIGGALAHLGSTAGFFNTTPITKPTGIGAAATDAATTQTLVNNLRTALINLGLVAS